MPEMQGFCHEARNLYHAYNNDTTQQPWPLPFTQYPYDEYISKQAQLYESQGRPYAAGAYSNDAYGLPQSYYRRDAGYWCEDYDQDIPARPSYFTNNTPAYWPQQHVPNVPELDMNRWSVYMNEGQQSPLPQQYSPYTQYPGQYPPPPSHYYPPGYPGARATPAYAAPPGSAPGHDGEYQRVVKPGEAPPPGVETGTFCEAVMEFCAPVQDSKTVVRVEGGDPQTTPRDSTTEDAGPSTSHAPMRTAGSANVRATAPAGSLHRLQPLLAASGAPEAGNPYTNAPPPHTQGPRPDSAFRAFYGNVPPGCDVHRVDYTDCTPVYIYPRQVEQSTAPPPRYRSPAAATSAPQQHAP